MKKRVSLLSILVLLLAVFTARAERVNRDPASDDPAALIVGNHTVTQTELKSAAVLSVFESALRCAGYGYEFDIIDRLNIEDDMDKLVFDLESWYVAQDLAEGMGLFPLNEDAAALAAERADAAWAHARDIAMSENGLAFLPAGIYQYREDDPEGNLVRYFASFGLTKESLLDQAVRDQTHAELQKKVTASMTGQSEEEMINQYTDWFLQKMDEVYIAENDEVIRRVIDELLEDPTENQDGEGYEAYERSILIGPFYYTLGESTVRDFERNGWAWTREADGRFSFEIKEKGNCFYARTDNGQPDGRLVMVDLLSAYDIGYEYLGIGFDQAFHPEADSDIGTVLEEIYGGTYREDGTLRAAAKVRGGTLLIEVREGALRLTLE